MVHLGGDLEIPTHSHALYSRFGLIPMGRVQIFGVLVAFN